MFDGHLQVFRLLDSSYFGSCRHSGSNNNLRISHVDWTLLSSFYTIGWELSPFPSTYVSYNQRPQESVCAFLVCRYSVSLGFLFRFPLGGPTTDHPCSLPASPDASGASDVIRYRPSQVTQDYRRTRNHHLCLAQILGSKVSRLLSSTMALPRAPFRVVPGPLTPSRMVMLLRHWAF